MKDILITNRMFCNLKNELLLTMLQHRQMVGRWDRKREKLFRKKYSQRSVKVADREKKKSKFYYKKKTSSTNLLENTM